MRLQIIVILLAIVGVATGLAQLGEEYITITVTSEGKAKITQTLFPETFVSTINVHIISEKISNLLAIDEKSILLGTTQNQNLLKIATLGAAAVDLKYNAGILTYESGIFKLKYNSDLESRVKLPPLSKLVSLNTIPIEITDKEYVLPPGDISLSYTIRPVTSKEFFVTVENSEQKIEMITATKIEEFSVNSDGIQFIIKEKAIVLTIIPKMVMVNPNDVLLNGEEVDFSQFHQNATHSWIRIDPHEKGLVRILNEENESGGCLIATATYGSEMAPQVQLLREIRDNQLMNTDSGVSFMTGFNQLYYSFSPDIADMERENPVFKEFVKIAISPMLLSLSIMTFAESENEILGLGIGVILLNIGMYFVLPFVVCYNIKKVIRTNHVKRSK
ncbi:MAG: CFI-box-CTERM domain-containing protein [Nitrosopumilus sp.]